MPPPIFPAASGPLSRKARWIAGLTAAGLALLLVLKRDWFSAYRALQQNPSPHLKEIIPGTLWVGLLAAAVLLAGLALTTPWWARHWTAAHPAEVKRPPRWFLWTLLLVVLTGAALRAPRLGLSLYNDEAHVFRLNLSGSVPRQFEGQPEKFKEVNWLSTLYENRAGNNSMPFAVLSRGSYDLWRKLTGTLPGIVNETALRLPVMVSGVLAIAAMGWLGLRLRGPWTGLGVAVLTAFQPWHIRYSVEARCYGILLLFIPLLFLALHRALRTGTWRAWLVFGLMQYLTVACFLGASHFVLAMNLCLVAMAVWPGLAARSLKMVSWPLLIPVAVSGVLSAALFLAVNFPLFWQSSRLMDNPDFLHGSLPLEWYQNAAALLTLGAPAMEYEPANPFLLNWERFWLNSPVTTALATALLAASLVYGLFRMIRDGGLERTMALSCASGALLTSGYCYFKGLILLQWYCIFLLPGAIYMAAAGFVLLTSRAHPWLRPLLWLPLIPLAILWAGILNGYLARSRENLRGAVETARAAPYPGSLKNPAGSLLVSFWSECPRYDGAIVSPRRDGDLEPWIERARTENRPLFVEHGFPNQMMTSYPQTFAMLNNPAEFETVAVLYGLDDAQNTHRVYRLLPTRR